MRMIPILFALSVFAPGAASACTLTVNNSGSLALSLDGTILGSEEAGANGAAITVESAVPATLQVDAPVLDIWPVGYNDGVDTVQIKYAGAGLLSAIFQDYTDQTTSFPVGIITATVLNLNARVYNPDAFETGNYRIRSTVTCS